MRRVRCYFPVPGDMQKQHKTLGSRSSGFISFFLLFFFCLRFLLFFLFLFLFTRFFVQTRPRITQ